MTKEEFWRGVPGLMSRGAFKELTGLSDRDLAGCVAEGSVTPWRSPAKKWGRKRPGNSGRKGKRGYAKYRKVDAARILGFE